MGLAGAQYPLSEVSLENKQKRAQAQRWAAWAPEHGYGHADSAPQRVGREPCGPHPPPPALEK